MVESNAPVSKVTYVHNGKLRVAMVGARGYRMDRVISIERTGSVWLIGYANAGLTNLAQVAHHHVEDWTLEDGRVIRNPEFRPPAWLGRDHRSRQ